MKTLEEVYGVVESINQDAYDRSFDSWMAVDQELDEEAAEDLRANASVEQSDNFRYLYWSLDEQDRRAIVYWIIKDPDFADQFKNWYDPDAFDEEIDLEL